ncbi:helix-turn-helix transcriptional regulator [bacterium]|nr:helix-turn-helix transcriptional regulator [bacterium]
MTSKKNEKKLYLRGAELCETDENFTKREIRILWLVIQGLDNKSIAKQISVAPCTIKFHLACLYKKTGTKNRTELTNKIFLKLMNYRPDFESFSKLLMSGKK